VKFLWPSFKTSGNLPRRPARRATCPRPATWIRWPRPMLAGEQPGSSRHAKTALSRPATRRI